MELTRLNLCRDFAALSKRIWKGGGRGTQTGREESKQPHVGTQVPRWGAQGAGNAEQCGSGGPKVSTQGTREDGKSRLSRFPAWRAKGRQ